MNNHRKRKCGQGTLLVGTFALVGLPGVSFSAEGGGSSYLQGTYGDFAAAVHPGSSGYLRNDVIYYDAGIGARPVNGGLDPGFDQKLWMDRLTVGAFADGGIFGGRLGIEFVLPYTFDLTVQQNGPGPYGSPRDQAMGDPIIKPQIAWGSGPHYSKFAIGIVLPWGTDDNDRVVSVGRDYWSFDPSFSYTFLNDRGWDFSATLGYMMNLEHSLPGPNYETGDELHLDAMLGKHFGDHFAFGIAGYYYDQITDDDGPIQTPPLDRGYPSEGGGFGPVIMFGSKNFSVVGKWLYDAMDNENRLDGDLYMLSFVARFGGAAPPPMPIAPPVARVEPPPPPPPPLPPADADGDGVIDLKDMCPATPRGDRVDVNGCACDVTVQVHFKTNSTEIYGADAIALNSLADQIRQLPTLAGEVGGHTDGQGSEAFNLDLSRRRALAARDYLASRGLNVSQLAINGYGESQPVADNTTPEGREQNRRVVLRRTNCQVGP